MKTLKQVRPLMLVMALSATNIGQAQVTNPTNNVVITDYVGCDNTSPFPLRIMQNDNQPIQWWTDSIHRMQLYHTKLASINGFAGIKQNGFLGISQQPLFYNSTVGPFSRLHLVDSASNNPIHYAQVYGYRPWMRNGITLTGNQDQCYIGQKYNGTTAVNDSSDIVLQWSDNPYDSPWSTDRLRFLFTNGYNSSWAYGSRSLEGLESFRIFIPNDTSANVGIGDFYRATVLNSGVTVDPTERLDVLDGRVRIRQLPTEAEMDTVTKMVVVNEEGVLGWQDVPTGGLGDCDWNVNNTLKYVTTGWTGAGSCNDLDWRVGIGSQYPSAKLTIQDDRTTGGVAARVENKETAATSDETGLFVRSYNGSTDNKGANIVSVVSNTYSTTRNKGIYSAGLVNSGGTVTSQNFGVDALAEGGGTVSHNYGGNFIAKGTGTITIGKGIYASSSGATTNYGLHGAASGGTTSYGCFAQANSATTNYGIWASAPNSGANYAGWFSGQVWITGNGWVNNGSVITSDAQLKIDVEDVQNANSLIQQLSPKTYYFDTVTFATMQLSNDLQYGMLAQEVESVIPEAVESTIFPAQYDSSGLEISAAMPIKGINYSKIIPLLIAGMKEQQQQIDQQQAQLASMQQQLNNCCTLDDDVLFPRTGQEGGALQEGSSDLKIAPNPFDEATTLSYTLAREGQVRLEVSDANGRLMRDLRSGQHERGSYQHTWNTQELAPGTYYVSLWLDEELLVKRAVKVAR